jgi:hypothetical protein
MQISTMLSNRAGDRKRKRNEEQDAEIKCYLLLQQQERDSFFQAIKSLYETESLCDIAFRVGGIIFRAHKVVLAAANRFGEQNS